MQVTANGADGNDQVLITDRRLSARFETDFRTVSHR